MLVVETQFLEPLLPLSRICITRVLDRFFSLWRRFSFSGLGILKKILNHSPNMHSHSCGNEWYYFHSKSNNRMNITLNMLIPQHGRNSALGFCAFSMGDWGRHKSLGLCTLMGDPEEKRSWTPASDHLNPGFCSHLSQRIEVLLSLFLTPSLCKYFT